MDDIAEASASSSSQQRRGRSNRVAPLSVQSYHARRGYFSVSDLVGPLWCEQAFTYNILGLGHLPVSERPATITLPSGNVIQPDRTIAERREEIQVQGREVHAKLEREIHPVQVYVHTKTEEDDWALRLLRLVIGLRSLLDRGCVRELPIVGWMQHHLVVGVIDEISRKPVRQPRRPPAAPAIPSVELSEDQSKLPFASVSVSNPLAPAGFVSQARSPGKKVWASQEEWKAHQRKVEAAKKSAAKSKKPSTSSPKRAKGASSSSPPASPEAKRQKGLAAFAGFSAKAKQEREPSTSISSIADPPVSAPPSTPPQPSTPPLPMQVKPRPHAFYMCDTKTRLFNSLPAAEDQRAGRLQLQIYRRLFDGLCLGAVERSKDYRASQGDIERRGGAFNGESAVMPEDDNYLNLDPEAQALDFAALFASLDLNAERRLSDVFLDDSTELLEDVDLSKLSLDAKSASSPFSSSTSTMKAASRLTTLSDVVRLVDATVLELINAAQRDAGQALSPDSALTREHAAVLHPELSLVYRLQDKRGKWTRNKSQQQRLTTKTKKQNEKREPAYHISDEEDEAELRLALQLSLEGQAGALTEKETSAAATRTVAMPSLPPSQGARRSRRLASRRAAAYSPGRPADSTTKGLEGSPAPATTAAQPAQPARPTESLRPTTPDRARASTSQSSRLIGISHFPHSPPDLTNHLISVLDFWLGRRPATGVSEDHSWRCKGCEFREGCEWREARGEEKREWAMKRREEKREEANGRAGEANQQEDDQDEEAALWLSFGGGRGETLHVGADEEALNHDEEDFALLDALESQHASVAVEGGAAPAPEPEPDVGTPS
ncbi:hypothetical protein BDZ90DRAFT_261949 [Jaminaea rosea]|uniref:Uncharacterized protein n=1 Tax=Jaminaea rosea TaxID=1569628 RepID=A0A316ULC7_9BASI|nr:hypothetical protein BDZ90DRAFT_261949 [Jaminaea rosea]PWN25744.1 hypothetical protein BDZ90DRAFT_261949 [Jaminaea rosea]